MLDPHNHTLTRPSLAAVAPLLGLSTRLASAFAADDLIENAAFEVSLTVGLEYSITRWIYANTFPLQPDLFLPKLLKSLLGIHGLEAAVAFGRRFAHLPYFRHVLEVLLLEALEEEDAVMHKRPPDRRVEQSPPVHTDNETDSFSSGLPQVVQFLNRFAQSTSAIIACARKSEAELWPRLFDVVGSPRNLFNVRRSPRSPS